jgi:hypothetical protein
MSHEMGPLGPLVTMVEELRKEIASLQRRWEALGGHLEESRRRLSLAEAFLEQAALSSVEGGSGVKGSAGADAESLVQKGDPASDDAPGAQAS